MIFINFCTISFALSNIFKNGKAFSLVILIARPNSIEKIIKANKLSLESNLEKSLVLMALTVLSNIFNSEFDFSIVLFNVSIILILLSVFTKDILVLIIPIPTLIKEVNINTIVIVVRIFFNLLGCFIFPIEVDIDKNISGTIITNNKFINKSPNGFNIFAFSPNMIPIIVPNIIELIKINVDL